MDPRLEEYILKYFGYDERPDFPIEVLIEQMPEEKLLAFMIALSAAPERTPLKELPKGVLAKIMGSLNVTSIQALCRVNKYLFSLCENPAFMNLVLIQKFGKEKAARFSDRIPLNLYPKGLERILTLEISERVFDGPKYSETSILLSKRYEKSRMAILQSSTADFVYFVPQGKKLPDSNRVQYNVYRNNTVSDIEKYFTRAELEETIYNFLILGYKHPYIRIEDFLRESDNYPANTEESYLACALCNQKANLLCGKCRTTAYCSKKCQSTNWMFHKKNCRA